MARFKIIAIKAFNDCNKKFTKILKTDEVYVLDKSFDFSAYETHGKIIDSKSGGLNIYSTNKLNINISAIVGKNGSGKSSLVELLYAAFYNISILENILSKPVTLKECKSALKRLNSLTDTFTKNPLKKIYDNVRIDLENIKQTIEDGNNIFQYSDINRIRENFLKLNKAFLPYINDEEQVRNFSLIESFINDLNYFIDNINVEIFYMINHKLNSIKINKRQLNYYEFLSSKNLYYNKQTLVDGDYNNKLFYNLAVNYSLYSLNAKELGSWINKIFHKNDSYQTPIVLNPMRTNGIIDVNRETHLSKSRLLSNILNPHDQSLQTLTSEKICKTLIFEINEEKLIDEFSKEEGIGFSYMYTEIYGDIIPAIKEIFNIPQDVDDEIDKIAIEYILKKLISISEKYKIYKNYELYLTNLGDTEDTPLTYHRERQDKIYEYLKILKRDRSHITLKLRQAINFLKYDTLLHSLYTPDRPFKIDINILTSNVEKICLSHSSLDVIEVIPPPFFSFDIKFTNSSIFSELSSGEKQLIYSMNSILYHLLNIDSVHKNSNRRNHSLIKYRYVNLIFDEIELYFHPEMQREFLSYIVKKIHSLDLRVVEAINIIFVTHSPFILSDILEDKVLYLDRGQTLIDYDRLTFGANIQELLADSFFMYNGFIGNIAREKIQDIIDILNEKKEIKDLNWANTANDIKKLIDCIGEPIIQDKLAEMYFMRFPNEREIEIKYLRQRLKDLGYDSNNN